MFQFRLRMTFFQKLHKEQKRRWGFNNALRLWRNINQRRETGQTFGYSEWTKWCWIPNDLIMFLMFGDSHQIYKERALWVFMNCISWPVWVCPEWGCSPQPGRCGGTSLWPPHCQPTGRPQCWQPAWPTSPCPLGHGCPVRAGRHNVRDRALLNVLNASSSFTLLGFHSFTSSCLSQ